MSQDEVICSMRSRLEALGALMHALWQEEAGQDLIEYSLLIAFVALASVTLFMGAGKSIKGIWSTSNSELVAANTSAS